MSEDTQATTPAAAEGPVGLGGWLIVPAINMALVLLKLVWSMYFLVLLKQGDPALPLPAGLDISDPAWARLLNYEFGTCMLLVCLLIVLFVLFFTRSWLFPRAFIAFWAFNLLLQLFDLMQIHSVTSLDADAFHGSYTALIRPVLYCVVWGSYFTQSVRVRNTFTRAWPVGKPVSAVSS